MNAILWTAAEAATATRGRALAATGAGWSATGVSIDSRTVATGDLFVALKGPVFDGHDFTGKAFAAGAAAALIHRAVEPAGPALVVGDTRTGLEDLGRAARARCTGRIVAVTGSVGKTGVKEGLRTLLSPAGQNLRDGRQPQQSLGRAAVARPPAPKGGIRGFRAGHEQSRRTGAALPHGPAACRADHDGGAGAYRILRQRRGSRRRESRRFSRA